MNPHTAVFQAMRRAMETSTKPSEFNPESTLRILTHDGSPSPAAGRKDGSDESAGHPGTDSPIPAATEPSASLTAIRSVESIIADLASGRADASMPMPQRIGLAAKICEAVATAHAAGIVLNDIKPSLVEVGIYGDVRLKDRGAATPEGGNRARPITGTPAYMSPELARGEPSDRISDIYALGATCWRLFTLHYPLWDTDPERFWIRKRRGDLDPAPVSTLQATPAAILEICTHALAARREDRYQSAAAMADDLRAVLAGKTASFVRRGVLSRCGRFLVRQRWAISAAALVAITILALGMHHQRRLASEQAHYRNLFEAGEQALAAYRAEQISTRDQLSRQERLMAEAERQQGWEKVAEFDFSKPVDTRFAIKTYHDSARIETDAIGLWRQDAGAFELVPSPNRTFIRWSEGVGEDARIDVEVESPGKSGWNLDITVAGDPMHGYRLRIFGRDHLALETVSRGWHETLVRVDAPPIADRERMLVSLQHLSGRIQASIDGRVILDHFDPRPLYGPQHRSVSVGRFFKQHTTRIRSMRIWKHELGESVGVLDPGITMLRQGDHAGATTWFAQVHQQHPDERIRAEASFLGALSLPTTPARREAMLALARTPGHPSAPAALFTVIDDMMNGDDLASLRELCMDLHRIAPPDLNQRTIMGIAGRMAEGDAKRKAALLAALSVLAPSYVSLSRCGLSDLSALRELRLTSITAHNNLITDAEPAVSPATRSVVLAGNLLAAFPTSGGLQLEQLDLSHNPLVSLGSLAGTPLRELRLNDTALRDLRSIAETKVAILDIARSPIADAAPLHNLPLEWLNMDGTRISDLSPLARCPLVILSIQDTPVSDLGPLSGVPTLVRLHAGGSRVTGLQPLHGQQVKYLDLSRTMVADVSPLAGTPLVDLAIERTPITDLRPIAGCPISTLNLRDAPVSDLEPLRRMPLRRLDLSGRARGSMQPLVGKQLEWMALPPGPFPREELRHLAGIATQDLQIDPASPEQWNAAMAMPPMQTINGLPRARALALREVVLILLGGGRVDLRSYLPTPSRDRFIALPIIASRQEAARLAELGGGRLPLLSGPSHVAALAQSLTAAQVSRASSIHLGIASDAEGRLVWSDGSPWTGHRIGAAESARLQAATGFLCFSINKQFEVCPANQTAQVIVEIAP